VAAATAFTAGVLALGVSATPAQAAAAPTTTTATTHAVTTRTAVTHVGPAPSPGSAKVAAAVLHLAQVAPSVAAIHDAAAPAPATRVDAAAAASAGDSAARSRLWHQTIAEFGILAAAFAVLARRSFRPLIARRATSGSGS
jgi:hypothetical protein